MTQQEHLLLIRAKCAELLELAKRRTPGRWYHQAYDSAGESTAVVSHGFRDGLGRTVALSPRYGNFDNDAAFIASAAGPFEAALTSTVAAIDGHLFSGACSEWCAEPPEYVTQIITSWPLELLQQ